MVIDCQVRLLGEEHTGDSLYHISLLPKRIPSDNYREYLTSARKKPRERCFLPPFCVQGAILTLFRRMARPAAAPDGRFPSPAGSGMIRIRVSMSR